MYTIRVAYDEVTDTVRYTVLRDGEYAGDYPTMTAARQAVARLTAPEPKQDPWQPVDPTFYSDRLPWRKS